MAEAKQRVKIDDAKNMVATGELRTRNVRGGRNLPATVFTIKKGAELEVIEVLINGEKQHHLGVVTDKGVLDPACLFRYKCSDAEAQKPDAFLEPVYGEVVSALGGEQNAIAISMAETGGKLTITGSQIPYYSNYRGAELLPEGRVRVAGKCYSQATWTPEK